MIHYKNILSITQSFYDIAKVDILIGYHFSVIDNFETHIARIADFWNLQINGEIQTKSHLPFEMLRTHKSLKINTGEVFRWVKLFEDNLENYKREGLISSKEKSLWMEKVALFQKKVLTLT